MRKQFLGSKAVGVALSVLLMGGAVPAVAAGETTTVTVGHESATVSFDAMFPAVTYIHVGDTITFTNQAKLTPHTVSFAGATGKLPAYPSMDAAMPSQKSGSAWDGSGLLNSGILEAGASYSVSFTAAGVYDYVCLLHPMMRGQIVVLPADVAVPKADAQAQMADMQYHDQMAQADAITAAYSDRLPEGKQNADGTITWTVHTGAGLNSFSVNQFFPSNLVVSEGDSVTFPNENVYEFHFVTFPTSPADQGKFFGPQGPNVEAMMTPAGGSVVDGSQMVNSGGIFPHQSKTFTFPKVGTYDFVCYIHGGSHMMGSITVVPKGAVHAYVNGKPLVSADSRAPHVHGQHVYVPVRAFLDLIGASIAYDDASQTVNVVTGGGKAEPKAGEGDGPKLIINGKQIKYDYAPGIHQHEGRTYAPAQELVNALGGQLYWDAATQTLMMEVR